MKSNLKLLLKLKQFFLGTGLLDYENILLYLCGNEALPSPLDSETELELILEAEKGDENAKHELVEHNLRLVVYISKKFENTGVDLEDLISVGAIGLIKAVNSFNVEKNIKLATFASRCIENEILMHLRKVSKQKNEMSLEEPLNTDSDGNELVLADIISMDNDSVTKNLEMQTEKEILYKCLEKLSDKEKQIISLRFGLTNSDEEKTQKEVADMLGISQSYISRIEKKIISRLKKELKKSY
ncbi:MAG: RNA polymerase sporulation sigma factor SigK [Clostridiales bacterium]|nr:RNA polymerase sporulation sigma factor SigK [Candidatus Apopatousia equi]